MSDLTSKVFALFDQHGNYFGNMLCTEAEAIRNKPGWATLFDYYLGIEAKKVVNGELVDK
jgi:hypothetical protein